MFPSVVPSPAAPGPPGNMAEMQVGRPIPGLLHQIDWGRAQDLLLLEAWNHCPCSWWCQMAEPLVTVSRGSCAISTESRAMFAQRCWTASERPADRGLCGPACSDPWAHWKGSPGWHIPSAAIPCEWSCTHSSNVCFKRSMALKFLSSQLSVVFVFLKMSILFCFLNAIHFHLNTNSFIFLPATFFSVLNFLAHPFSILIMYNLKYSKKIHFCKDWSVKKQWIWISGRFV